MQVVWSYDIKDESAALGTYKIGTTFIRPIPAAVTGIFLPVVQIPRDGINHKQPDMEGISDESRNAHCGLAVVGCRLIESRATTGVDDERGHRAIALRLACARLRQYSYSQPDTPTSRRNVRWTGVHCLSFASTGRALSVPAPHVFCTRLMTMPHVGAGIIPPH